jgi:lipoate-protein ligase B
LRRSKVHIEGRLFRIDLGRTRYKEIWDLQKKLVNLRAEKQIPDCLLLTEHEPVITMGRATQPNNLLCSPDYLNTHGIDLFAIERGGDITFHSPGQLIVYPIIDLTDRGRDLHQYLRDLESVTIATLGELGLKAKARKGLTGVWVNNSKLAAIGVAVSRWITYHGLALNVSTNLDYFKLINPCGITEYPVGSISGLLGRDVGIPAVSNLMADNFTRLLGYDMEIVNNINSIIPENMAV